VKKNPKVADPHPDREALAALGEIVRARLDADGAAYRIPVEEVEIYAISDFLSPSECERFMAMVDATARPSDTFDPGEQNRYRTSYSGDVDYADPFVAMIERRIDDLMGINPLFGEIVQGQRYTQGQEYQGHCDFFAPLAAFFQREIPMGGQRSWTAMIYLNDVEAGGATDFPHIGVNVVPRQGMLLAWNNARRDGTPNTYTLHAAQPVERGVKYVITKWYRTRVWAPEWRKALKV
jgi:prolyl 4-hydroxylase